MRHVITASLVALATVAGCNLHSGSGLEPDTVLHADQGAGASGSGGDGGDNEGGFGSSSGSGTGSSSGFGSSGASSSSGAGSGSGSGSGGSSGSGSGGDFPDTGVSTDGSSPGLDAGADSNGPIDQSCAANPSTCLQCCANSYPPAFQQWASLVHPCVCGSGPCASVCSNEFCLKGAFLSATDACAMCVQQAVSTAGACNAQELMCESEQPCAALVACSSGCPGGGG